MSVDEEKRLPVSRKSLPGQIRSVLHRGGWGNPDVLLIDSEIGPVVVKDFAPRSSWVRSFLGPWLLTREIRAYKRLESVRAVPQFLGRVDEQAMVIEYRPGVLLSRSLAGKVPVDFLMQLEEAIADLHRHGIVHLDLRHRSNILAGEDGRPVVIDFASALCFKTSNAVGRYAIRLLGQIDRNALRKWQKRLV